MPVSRSLVRLVVAWVAVLGLNGSGSALAASGAGAYQADGLTPAQIHQAYSLPSTGPKGQTIAVVVAYNHPKVASELAAYLGQFSLRPCTTQTRCLRTINQSGQSAPLPGADLTGGQLNIEAAVSSEVARAVCQSCSILIVEANSESKRDLSTAVATAARAGAGVIETTFTPPEEETDSQYAADFASPKAAVVSASGDLGFYGSGTFPASLPNVIAIGGTSLRLGARGGYAGETAWSSSTSACSLYRIAPAWQSALATSAGCGDHRAIADVSAVADPGALIYVSDSGVPGPWFRAGGTSVSAPIIAGVIGLAGSVGSGEAQMLYAHARSDSSAFRDIRTGSTTGCDHQRICAARPGYDGPTGLGTPYGLAAFLPSGGALDARAPQFTLSAPSGLHSNRKGQIRLPLQNDNSVAVTGSITVQQTIRVGARRRLIRFAATKVALGPLQRATSVLQLARAERTLLARLRTVQVQVLVSLRGPAGRSVLITRRLHLYAP